MLFIQLLTRLSVSAQQHTLETRAAGLSPFARCRYIFWISRLYAFLVLSNMTLQICSRFVPGAGDWQTPVHTRKFARRSERVKMFPLAPKWISRTEASEGEAEPWFKVRTVNNEEQTSGSTLSFVQSIVFPFCVITRWDAFHLSLLLPHLSLIVRAPPSFISSSYISRTGSVCTEACEYGKKNPMELEENILLINSKWDLAIKVTFTPLNTPH